MAPATHTDDTKRARVAVQWLRLKDEARGHPPARAPTDLSERYALVLRADVPNLGHTTALLMTVWEATHEADPRGRFSFTWGDETVRGTAPTAGRQGAQGMQPSDILIVGREPHLLADEKGGFRRLPFLVPDPAFTDRLERLTMNEP